MWRRRLPTRNTVTVHRTVRHTSHVVLALRDTFILLLKPLVADTENTTTREAHSSHASADVRHDLISLGDGDDGGFHLFQIPPMLKEEDQKGQKEEKEEEEEENGEEVVHLRSQR